MKVLHPLMTSVITDLTNANMPVLQELILTGQNILIQEVH